MPGARWLSLALVCMCASCSPSPTPTPIPIATTAPAGDFQPRSGAVRAAGKVVPAGKADLSFPVAGRVQKLAVAVGDTVNGDAVLAVVEQAAASTAVVQARGALFRAQANLAEVRAGARPQEIAAAQAQVDTLRARLDQMSEASRPEAVAAARAELAAAQTALQQVFAGPNTQERIAAQVEIANADAALRQAQSAYDQVSSRNDVAMLPESRALQQATNNHEAAQARYEALSADPDADVVAAARAQVQQAQAALDQLLNPATASQLAEAEAQVRGAQAELDLLRAGARDEALAAAAIAVTEAQATLEGAESDLADTSLRTPLTGTVTSVAINVGEMAQPGQVVVTVADLDHLQVETTDLSERDVARVATGQAAVVFVEPLGIDVPGHVAQIAPAATIIGGDVVYKVVIALDQQPPGLRWGMSAQVEIAND